MLIMLLLKVISIACIAAGYRTWRWYRKRAHQGLKTEGCSADEEVHFPPREFPDFLWWQHTGAAIRDAAAVRILQTRR